MNKIFRNFIIAFLVVGNVCFGQSSSVTPQSQNNENVNSSDTRKVSELICPNTFLNAKENISPQQCMSEFAYYFQVKFEQTFNEFYSDQNINGCYFRADSFLNPNRTNSSVQSLRKHSSDLKNCSISASSDSINGDERNCYKVWNAFLKDYERMKSFNIRLQNFYREDHQRVRLGNGQSFDGNLCAAKVETLFSKVDNKSVEQYTNVVLPEQIKAELEISKKIESARLQRIYEEDERVRKEKEAIQNQKIQEANQKSPESDLQDKYALYMFARDCYDVRKDFRVQYINPSTFGQIKNSIKNFENEFKRKNPKINTNEKWLLAEKQYLKTTFQLIEMARFSPKTFHSELNILCSAAAFELNAVSNSTIQKKDF